jgi:iron complex outermembrane receptor protein
VVQDLRTDDRIAFPFGCADAASGTYYADRYCPDGSFDLQDWTHIGARKRL